MVDVTRLSAGETRIARIAGVSRPGAIAGDSQSAPSPARTALDDRSGVGNLARTLSAQPPVNQDRVEEIRRAIAKGDFPILPATIADQMIALKLNWNGK